MALSLTYNSYASVAEANYFFEDRMDVTTWTSATDIDKAKALVSATRQIDKERFVGSATSSTQALSFPRTGSFMDDRTGFHIDMDNDYDFTASQPLNGAGYAEWFHGLPREIRYLKTAVYEQALWLISNSGVINSYSETSTSGGNETIRVGSIEISGSAASSASSTTRRTNPTYYANLKSIMANGGSATSAWWRAN
jgi:hypothetical protein